ncbi:hypothetical protein BACPLE_00548 [Phocaeicola plebeius DSM 17135]|uniref:Uncharacterized protein n=1 Tax=Phocaeicola plebeius (strain DSM 17135 / JCM 12973 / CCUG 54634 / M2) TaxID=484018 RepID=B5CV22_PHOPM|nr:hypothetical protein BACPLE_00548 [Phocaeicola plebeius DSM 17135]
MQKRKKSVPLQPLSRGRAAEDDRLSKAGATEESAGCCTEYLTLRMSKGARKGKPHAFLKPSEKFFQKKTLKKFGGYEKTPYLCKRFPAETGA